MLYPDHNGNIIICSVRCFQSLQQISSKSIQNSLSHPGNKNITLTSLAARTLFFCLAVEDRSCVGGFSRGFLPDGVNDVQSAEPAVRRGHRSRPTPRRSGHQHVCASVHAPVPASSSQTNKHSVKLCFSINMPK